MATKKRKLSENELNSLHKTVAEGIETLHAQSEIGDGGRARILFYALAMFLDERGIVDHLKGAATWAGEQTKKAS